MPLDPSDPVRRPRHFRKFGFLFGAVATALVLWLVSAFAGVAP